jgi:hypothetical protein
LATSGQAFSRSRQYRGKDAELLAGGFEPVLRIIRMPSPDVDPTLGHQHRTPADPHGRDPPAGRVGLKLDRRWTAHCETLLDQPAAGAIPGILVVQKPASADAALPVGGSSAIPIAGANMRAWTCATLATVSVVNGNTLLAPSRTTAFPRDPCAASAIRSPWCSIPMTWAASAWHETALSAECFTPLPQSPRFRPVSLV